MPPKRIPYRRVGGPDQPHRPFLELYIGGQSIPFYGLVDSGADYSTIPIALARRIGVEYDETAEEEGSAVSGLKYKYFTATNRLAIHTEVGGLTFDLADVSAEEDFILGRHDFFRRYRVTFNERAQEIEIEPSDVLDGRPN